MPSFYHGGQPAADGAEAATIRIDGLPRSQERLAAARLRLADAVCGWRRAASEGQPVMQAMLERAIRLGTLCDVGR